MTTTAPSLRLSHLNREYLRVKREVDQRPNDLFFAVPLDKLKRLSELRNLIVLHQNTARKASTTNA